MPRFKQVPEIQKLLNRKELIRNVGIIAHIDHGKTTLADTLLAGAGLLSPQMAGSARVLDFLEEEQKRKITIKTASISLLYRTEGESYVINLVDTPGHVDFTGKVTRATKETEVAVELNLDGAGRAEVTTGIGFLDHMLELLARHSRIDIKLQAKGDLHVDQHHTTEDAGIVLGQAVKKALGDMRGIARYADVHMPMDEALTRVAVDLSGRAVLVFKVEFPRDKIGEFDVDLVREFFQAFAANAGVTLHVETLYGDNSHHVAESCFKGLARVLRAAVALDPAAKGEIPSTKGSLG